MLSNVVRHDYGYNNNSHFLFSLDQFSLHHKKVKPNVTFTV